MICEKCNSKMIPFKEGLSQGWFCKCGWGCRHGWRRASEPQDVSDKSHGCDYTSERQEAGES